MTRFNITINEAIELALFSLQISKGEEIIVPKLPSYRVIDLVKAISSKPKINIIGIRPGEKIHEELIAESNALNRVEAKNFYIILKSLSGPIYNYYIKKFKSKRVKKNFSYTSGNNNYFLNSNNIKKLIGRYN